MKVIPLKASTSPTPVQTQLEARTRYELLESVLRQASGPRFLDELNRLRGAAVAAAAVHEGGGRLRRLLARLLCPTRGPQARYNQLVIDRFAELAALTGALADDRARMTEWLAAELETRLEELRTDLLLERAAPASPDTPVEAARARAILALTRHAPRLYLGRAPRKRDGFFHVDEFAGPAVEWVAPLDRLPAEPGTVLELVADRVLERYQSATVAQRLLPHWVSRLRLGGKLVLVAFDLEAAAERFRTGDLAVAEFVKNLFGTGLRPDDTRRCSYTPCGLRDLVAGAGLGRATVTARRHDWDRPAFVFEVEAHRAA